MATVRVTSELVETDGSEKEEFFASSETLDDVVQLMLTNERQVAHEEWVGWIELDLKHHYALDGFSFTEYDAGSGVLYRYTFTA